MADVGTIASNIWEKIAGFFGVIGDWVSKTGIPDQIADVEVGALFTNPWFIIPFLALVGWMIYKQKFRDMIIMGLLIAAWYASGTQYMQTLVVGDELQINKVLPVLFGGALGLGIVIYLLFGRSN